MANEVNEWWKIIGTGGVMATLGWLSKQYNWFRKRPKEAIDVKKVEQEIKSDQVTTAIEVTNLMLTRLAQAEVRVTNVQNENDKLRVVIVELRSELADIKQQSKDLVDDLTECLQNADCEERLKKLKEKYGIID